MFLVNAPNTRMYLKHLTITPFFVPFQENPIIFPTIKMAKEYIGYLKYLAKEVPDIHNCEFTFKKFEFTKLEDELTRQKEEEIYYRKKRRIK